jgi:uncharacterized SAM-binding protein YcdF (DUF218 family)
MDGGGRAAEAPQAVVVLGAEVLGPGSPTPAVRRRLERGVEVWHRSGRPALVVCGGVGGAGVSEASVMRDLAVGLGVPREAVVLEEASRNTLEQAVAVAGLARQRSWDSVVVVSDRFHLPRARFLFRRMGLVVESAAVSGRLGTSRRRRLASWGREGAAWVKVAWQMLNGRLGREAAALGSGPAAPP